MDKKSDPESMDVIVSESALQNGYFGVYGIASDQPDSQIYLSGGFESIEDAMNASKNILQALRSQGIQIPENYVVKYHERENFQLAENYPLLEKENLVESVTTHINQWFIKLTKKNILKGLLSHGNLMFYGTGLVIWIYWTDNTFTVPDLDLPIVGKSLSGKVLDRSLVASYYPIALFLLYAASFFKMLRTNLSYNELRLKILVLVKVHSWSLLDFAKVFEVSSSKSANPWFFGLMRWLHSNDLNSFASLVTHFNKGTESNKVTESKVSEANGTELKNNLQRWVRSEFDQRFHNLLYLDKEQNFRSSYMCFDPIVYLMMNNRTVFRLYSYLKSNGYHVHEIGAPNDPYMVQKMFPFVFWFGVIFSVCLFGGTCLWSFRIEHSSLVWTILGAVATLISVAFPNWWNYRAVIGRRGFPTSEPIGAYTGGRYAVNRLSIVGW